MIALSTQLPGSINTQVTNHLIDEFKNQECTNEKIKSSSLPIWPHLLVLPISPQVTIALAKIFDFEILTHGTSFTNCYEILKNGADPSKGGSEIGSTHFYVGGDINSPFKKNACGYFHVFKDTEAKDGIGCQVTSYTNHPGQPRTIKIEFKDENGNVCKEQQFVELSFKDRLWLYFLPRLHAVLATFSYTLHVADKNQRMIKQTFYGVASLLFSPTLRFIYSLDETKNIFIDDPHYVGCAYKTSEKLPNNRIGLIGVCKHANIERLKNGIKKRPLRLMAGVVHLLMGSILTSMGLGIFI